MQCDYELSQRLSRNIAELQEQSDIAKNEIMGININNIEVDSNIDGYDFLFCTIFGIIGALVSTSEAIEKFNDSIHEIASGKKVKNSNNLQEFLGNLLSHTKDDIDTVFDGERRIMINRSGERAVFMHRLLRGHDPLSFQGDNPISVLCSQHGVLRGLVQVIRHLLADTFSKEGLPVPGHSFFDFKNEDGRLSNYLISISKKLSNQSLKTDTRSVFEGAFTIHAQDIASQGIVYALCKGYESIRSISNPTRVRQNRVIAYGVNFFTHACIGTARQGGIPYIHWPALLGITKEFSGLYIDSYREIKDIEKNTANIVQMNLSLEKQVFETGKSIITFDDSDHYFTQMKKEENTFDDLTNFFEEE